MTPLAQINYCVMRSTQRTNIICLAQQKPPQRINTQSHNTSTDDELHQSPSPTQTLYPACSVHPIITLHICYIMIHRISSGHHIPSMYPMLVKQILFNNHQNHTQSMTSKNHT